MELGWLEKRTQGIPLQTIFQLPVTASFDFQEMFHYIFIFKSYPTLKLPLASFQDFYSPFLKLHNYHSNLSTLRSSYSSYFGWTFPSSTPPPFNPFTKEMELLSPSPETCILAEDSFPPSGSSQTKLRFPWRSTHPFNTFSLSQVIQLLQKAFFFLVKRGNFSRLQVLKPWKFLLLLKRIFPLGINSAFPRLQFFSPKTLPQ